MANLAEVNANTDTIVWQPYLADGNIYVSICQWAKLRQNSVCCVLVVG